MEKLKEKWKVKNSKKEIKKNWFLKKRKENITTNSIE